MKRAFTLSELLIAISIIGIILILTIPPVFDNMVNKFILMKNCSIMIEKSF